MKTKHRGLLAIAAVTALSLTACAGGADEPAAAPSSATQPEVSATGTPEVLAGAQGPGVGVEDYLLGSWWCKTTGDSYYPSLFGLPPSSDDLPEEMTFQGDGRWLIPGSSVLREWEYIDDTMLIEIEDGDKVLLDLPATIQIPSTVTVTSHAESDSGAIRAPEASNDISFEFDKMTMQVAEYTDPNKEPPSDSGATVTCRK